jgi:hypothetical protein
MSTDTPRATRLLLPLPISYRLPGDEEWLTARIRNISESGVMFAPADLSVGQKIEVIISTPVSIQSIAAGQLLFSATVVRAGADNTAAAEFEESRFLLNS